MKTKNLKKQVFTNVLLAVALLVSAVSGGWFHSVGEKMPYIIHIASSLIAVMLVSIHVYRNRRWYGSLFKQGDRVRKHHSKGTIILSAVFLTAVVTGVLACMNDSTRLYGMVHGKFGLLTILCVIVHIAKHRRHKFTLIEGTPHVNVSRCVGCGICASGCPKSVFEIRQTKTTENIGIAGKFKYRHRNGNKSFVVNADACIRCGHCMRECPKRAIKFMN
jgi:NAD-dependent dihydropyrimidine dehydrogenase PreA subunit